MKKPAAFTSFLLAMVVIVVGLNGCGSEPQGPVANVAWDLSSPTDIATLADGVDSGTPPEALGSSIVVRSAGELGDEHNRVATNITLPGGETIEGNFNRVVAREGANGLVRYLTITFAGETNPDHWEDNVGGFTSRWRGDKGGMGSYIRTKQNESERSEAQPTEYRFAGESNGPYLSSIHFLTTIRPFTLYVTWEFDVNPLLTTPS